MLFVGTLVNSSGSLPESACYNAKNFKQQFFSVKHVAKLIIRYVKYTAILMDALHLVIVTELYIFNVS